MPCHEEEIVCSYLGGVDRDRDRLAVGLVARDALDVDAPLLAVHLDDLALTVVVGATDDHHLVIAADGEGADVVPRQRTGNTR